MRKILLDVILLALFVAELSFHHLPKILHEIFGIALTVLLLVHVASNRRRFMSLTKKISPRKIFSVTINFLLIICAAVTAASGVCMSNYLFAEAVSFALRRNMTLHQLHVALPYAMMILLGVHVGLHWRELLQRFSPQKNFFRAVVVTLAAFGAVGLVLNRVGDRILMKHIFATPATELPAAVFALMIVGGVILFALITFLLDEKIYRNKI